MGERRPLRRRRAGELGEFRLAFIPGRAPRSRRIGLDSGSLLRSFRNDKILLLAQNSPSVIAGLDPAIHSDHQHLPHFIMDRRIKPGDNPMRFIAISSHSLPIFDCQTAIRTCALVSAPALFAHPDIRQPFELFARMA
jgi:hypothetical protein